MLPWVELGRVPIPGERQPLVLAQRGTEFVIRLGAKALMGSTAHGSEEALAELSCLPMAGYADTRVLIGGLGMGYTLAAALRALPADARVTVAELFPAVVEWNRGPLAELAGRPLEDARVTVFTGDVADAFRKLESAFDAILLDVDNGPNALTQFRNGWLYSLEGLRIASRALRVGGVLGVWSVAPDDAFTRRLQAIGFSVDTQIVRARKGGKGGRHTLWLATKGSRHRR